MKNYSSGLDAKSKRNPTAGESIIPALDALIENAAEQGVEHFVMGMAHRGRLNVLANIFGKNTQDIFSEFDGKDYFDQEYFDGDVKYHLGLTAEKTTSTGKVININLKESQIL